VLGRDLGRDQPADREPEAASSAPSATATDRPGRAHRTPARLARALSVQETWQAGGRGGPEPPAVAANRRSSNRRELLGLRHQPVAQVDPVERPRPVVERDEEGQRPLERGRQPGDVGEPEPPVPAGGDDPVDGPLAEARDAQQELARRRIDVDREPVAVLQRPGELRVGLEVEHAALAALRDLVDGEAVVAQQPVGLVEPVLALERRRLQGQERRGLGDRREGGVVDPGEPVTVVEQGGGREHLSSVVSSAPTITCVDWPAGEKRRRSAFASTMRSWVWPIADLMLVADFSGARRVSAASVGSSRLIDSRSAQRPACSISQGLASGMVLRWM
jgi:hypothetical protein